MQYLNRRFDIFTNMGRNILAVLNFVLVADLCRLHVTIFHAPIATPVETTKSGAIVAIEIKDAR